MADVVEMARATRVDRDRYVDLLRVGSLGVVVVGHWVMAVVVVGGDGTVTATNVLALQPWLQPVTWLLQVMPVFFFVGGFSHAVALESIQRRGGGYADFVRSRASRLLRPTAVFVGVWLALALAVELTGHDRGVLRLATGTVAQPLWFVGVYLGVVALAPAMLRLHRRLAARAFLAPVALAAVACLVDIARFTDAVPFVAYLNVAFVWLAVHQLGFLYADGTLTRFALALAGVGFAATWALTTFGPYPTSMVGMPGDPISNMSPPTVALLAQAVGLIGLVLLLREPARRWLARPRVWTNVIAYNGVAMTAFLWHLTAMFVVTAVTIALGLSQPAVGSGSWWLVRPMWISVVALCTAALVLVFQGADRPRPAGPPAPAAIWRTVAAAVGMVACVIGVLGFSAVGFGGLLAGRASTLVILPVTPLWSAAILGAGAVLLRATRVPTIGSHDHRPESGPAGHRPTDHLLR